MENCGNGARSASPQKLHSFLSLFTCFWAHAVMPQRIRCERIWKVHKETLPCLKFTCFQMPWGFVQPVAEYYDNDASQHCANLQSVWAWCNSFEYTPHIDFNVGRKVPTMSQAVQAVQAPTRNVPDKCVDAAGHAEVFLVKMCTARSFADFCRCLDVLWCVTCSGYTFWIWFVLRCLVT